MGRAQRLGRPELERECARVRVPACVCVYQREKQKEAQKNPEPLGRWGAGFSPDPGPLFCLLLPSLRRCEACWFLLLSLPRWAQSRSAAQPRCVPGLKQCVRAGRTEPGGSTHKGGLQKALWERRKDRGEQSPPAGCRWACPFLLTADAVARLLPPFPWKPVRLQASSFPLRA